MATLDPCKLKDVDLTKLKPFEWLGLKTLDMRKVVDWHFQELLKKAHNQISTKQKFRNPWTVSAEVSMYYHLFMEVFSCFEDYRPKYHFTVEAEKYKSKNEYEFKSLTVRFTCVKVAKKMLCMLTKLTEGKFGQFLRKDFEGGFTARVVASEEKPIILFFNTRNHTMTFSAHYELKNEYGLLM